MHLLPLPLLHLQCFCIAIGVLCVHKRSMCNAKNIYDLSITTSDNISNATSKRVYSQDAIDNDATKTHTIVLIMVQSQLLSVMHVSLPQQIHNQQSTTNNQLKIHFDELSSSWISVVCYTVHHKMGSYSFGDLEKVFIRKVWWTCRSFRVLFASDRVSEWQRPAKAT